MPKWPDPRGSILTTSQARPGIVLRPTIGIPQRLPDPEFTFGKIGLGLHDKGWAVIPQTSGRDGKPRQPGFHRMYVGTPHHGRIRYKTQYAMHQQMPDRQIVEMWKRAEGLEDLNVAGVPGDSPGDCGWFALDGDILDGELAAEIWAAADRRFGYTPLLRGRPSTSKGALIYRRKLGALRLPRKNFVLIDEFGDEKQQLEIKDDGALLTLYGRHHAQGELYAYMREAEPYTVSPFELPEVDEEQIIDFMGGVHEISEIAGYEKIRKQYAAAPVQWVDADVGEIRTPPMSKSMSESPVLSDSRRRWLLVRSKPWTRYNAGIVAPIVGDSRAVNPAGVDVVAKALFDESVDFLDYTANSKLTPTIAMRVIREMVRGDAVKIAAGDPDFAPMGTRRLDVESKKAEPEVRQGVVQTDDELSWLPAPKSRKRLPDEVYKRTDPDAAIAATLALRPNDLETTQRVSREIEKAYFAFFDAIWDFQQAKGKNVALPAHLLKAPTGSGKTTALPVRLAQWKARHPERKLGPLLVLLPSNTNMDELASREDLGIWSTETEDRANEIMPEANGVGVKLEVLRGKIAAGCGQEDKVRLLQAAGKPTSRLCHADDIEEYEENGHKLSKKVERWCPFHPENPDRDEGTPACGALSQLLMLPSADIILAPHAYITSNVPKIVKDVISGVIIDEKIWDKTIGVRFFPLKAFTSGRPEPIATKKEKEKGLNPAVRLQSRDRIGELVAKIATERKDIARAIADMEQGKTLLDEARWVTGALQRSVFELNPDTPLSEIRADVGKQRTKHLVEEQITIGLLQERVGAIADAKPVFGDTDARIQLIDGDVLRVSWRKELNFLDLPIMWLDASGDEQILERIWDVDITVHHVDAPLYVRTVWTPDGSYAKSRILPHRDDGSDEAMAKAAKQVLLREAMSTLSIFHGDSAVVSGFAMSVRKHLFSGWQQPSNLHPMHFGAVRGIDFAKHHNAAFSVGQLEMPPAYIDAYTGALTYDLSTPEKPIDFYGNGKLGPAEDAKPISRRMVPRQQQLRDGGVATVKVYEPEGHWAALLVKQVRDEELAQYLGRLRPVYRSGNAPTWYHCGRVLPAGVVVDEVIGLEDLARPFGRSIPILHEMAIGGFMGGGRLGHLFASGVSNAALASAEERFRNSERLQRGVDIVEFTADGEKRTAFVPAWAGDAAAKINDVFAEPSDIRIVRQARVRSFGLPKPDKVDAEIGDADKRAAEFNTAMAMITTKVIEGFLTYDDKRSGIVHQGRAQVPHLVVAIEAFKAAVAELNTAPDLLAGVDPDHLILGGMSAEMMAPILESYADDVVDAIFVAVDVPEPIAAEVRAARLPKPAPAEVSFGKAVTMPTPANSSVTVLELPPNVVKLAAISMGFRPLPRAIPTGTFADRQL